MFLGDYIDRGPDSRGCIDAVMSFRQECRANVVGLRGNHEDWMLRTFADYASHSWLLGMEGLVTVRSYSQDAERALVDAISAARLSVFLGGCRLPYEVFFDAMPASHRDFFTGLALLIETPDCLCAHAGLDPAAPFAEQPQDALVWGIRTFPGGYAGSKPVVYGHWNNAQLDADGWPRPFVSGNTIGIDTIAHGVLTAIRLPDRRVFQSRRYAVAPR